MTNPAALARPSDSAWTGLYKTGGAAALIAAVLFRRNMDAEFMLLRAAEIIQAGPVEAPTTIADWFNLLQNNRLVGLTFLGLFDLVNYALVGLIFLALCAALWRASPSLVAAAAALSLAGITAYFASNQAFTMLSLSGQYAAATGDAQRTLFLAAGQAVLAMHNNASFAGAGIYVSFLLVSVAGLLFSRAMLRSGLFNRATAWAGLLANGFGLGYYLTLAFAPGLVFLPLSISALFLLAWYFLTGIRLFRMG